MLTRAHQSSQQNSAKKWGRCMLYAKSVMLMFLRILTAHAERKYPLYVAHTILTKSEINQLYVEQN